MLDFYTILTQLRDEVAASLGNTVGKAPARVAVVPGAIAWDDCDQCGLLALALVRTFLADQLPSETPQAVNVFATQGALLCADMAIQVVRCAPGPDNVGGAPATSALESSAQVVIADASTVICTTIDTLNSLMLTGSIADFLVRQGSVMGPEGACVGSELTFAVAVVR